MPIIINGASRRAGGWWGKHLENQATNERVEVVEMRGLSAATVPAAFREMQALARGTKCENYFYQANINPRADETLTPAQWRQAVDALEKNLGLTGQPRFVIEHEKDGRTHRHIVWSRIDTERMVAISDSLTAAIHERTSRELEIAFDLERGRSILVRDRDFERPERRPKKHETIRALDTGIDPQAVKAEVSALWRSADNARSFKAALEERGYILARGDRRDFVIIDQAGDDHSLARRAGVKTAELRERMKEIDAAGLPSVTEARDQQRARHPERAPHFDRDAADARWLDQVTAAAIAKGEAALAPPAAEPEPQPESRRYDPLRATERAVEGAAFKGRYDELRAAEPAPEVVRLFEANAARTAEPPAATFDRDAADAAWMDKVAAAGIAHAASHAAQESHEPAAPVRGADAPGRAGEPVLDRSAAPDMAQPDAAAPEEHNLRSLEDVGSRILGSFGKAILGIIGALGDFFAPAPRLTRDQAERAELVADERREQQAWAAYHRELDVRRDGIAEQQRTRDIARTLQLEPVSDPEEDRFRQIMQRSARDRDREYERER